MASPYPAGYGQPQAYGQQSPAAAHQQSYAQQAPAQYAGGPPLTYPAQQSPPTPAPNYSTQQQPAGNPSTGYSTQPAGQTPPSYHSQPAGSPPPGYSAQQQPASTYYGQPGSYGAGGYSPGRQPTGPYAGVQAANPYAGYQHQPGNNPQFNRNTVVPNPNVHNPTGQLWSSSLFGCFDDFFVCCVGYYLPGVLYGENYRKVYNDGFCCNCILYSCCGWFSCCFANRTRAALRQKYNLPEEPCGDCCVHCFCSPCALCQESREMRIRSGWKTWH